MGTAAAPQCRRCCAPATEQGVLPPMPPERDLPHRLRGGGGDVHRDVWNRQSWPTSTGRILSEALVALKNPIGKSGSVWIGIAACSRSDFHRPHSQVPRSQRSSQIASFDTATERERVTLAQLPRITIFRPHRRLRRPPAFGMQWRRTFRVDCAATVLTGHHAGSDERSRLPINRSDISRMGRQKDLPASPERLPRPRSTRGSFEWAAVCRSDHPSAGKQVGRPV